MQDDQSERYNHMQDDQSDRYNPMYDDQSDRYNHMRDDRNDGIQPHEGWPEWRDTTPCEMTGVALHMGLYLHTSEVRHGPASGTRRARLGCLDSSPAYSWETQKSMRLKYEPSSAPLHISAK